jgi:hypothetical protein
VSERAPRGAGRGVGGDVVLLLASAFFAIDGAWMLRSHREVGYAMFGIAALASFAVWRRRSASGPGSPPPPAPPAPTNASGRDGR